MMTPDQYRKSLSDLHIKARIRGERIHTPLDHPVVHAVLNEMIKPYEMARMPQYEEIVTATSHLTGGRINRFNHVHQNIDDLYKKDILNELFARNNGHLFPRTRAMNALNALSITTCDIEEKYGTGVHARFCNYIKYIQDNDLICDGSMVDPTPNRCSTIPYNRYADLFVHLVENSPEGLVIRGVKALTTHALTSHELLVFPTCYLSTLSDRHCIACALPIDTPGITLVFEQQPSPISLFGGSIIDRASQVFYPLSNMCVFDNVFVPWERVFLNAHREFVTQFIELLEYNICFQN